MSQEEYKEKLNILEANVRTLIEEKTGLQSELHKLNAQSEKLKVLESIMDTKETEYQKLARTIGYEPLSTALVFKQSLDHRNLEFEKLIYHQLTYWNIIEFSKLSVLQEVVKWYCDLITLHFQNLELLTHAFSGASLLLYMLFKNKNADLDELIKVGPIDVKPIQGEPKTTTSNDLIFPIANSNRLRIYAHYTAHENAESLEKLITRSAPVPSISNRSDNGNTKDEKYHHQIISSQRQRFSLTPIKSSNDFFNHLKTLVGTCFGLLLSFVGGHLDPLLEEILTENSASRSNEILSKIISFLQKVLSAFQANSVHHTLSRQFFSEVFIRINNFLMNGVLVRQQLCTETFGSFLKTQIEKIQSGTTGMSSDWIGDAGVCFQGIKQITTILTMPKKFLLAEEATFKSKCPTLNSLQVHQLLSMFTPGEYEKKVPIPTIEKITSLALQAETDSYLLDINFVRPFPIKVLHYYEIEDILKEEPSQSVRAFVKSIGNK